MYLWVILATFITMLYSFNLSVRPDMDRVHAESKAGVVVAKMRAQQNALKDCFAAQEPARTGRTSVDYYPGDGINIAEGSGIDWINRNDTPLSYRDALPLGYKQESGDNAPVSKVFCFYDMDYTQNCTTPSGSGSCCSDEYTGIYVVTFQPIPSRFMNKNTGQPSADLIGAMNKLPGYGTAFGYTTVQDGKLVLSHGRRVIKYSTTTDEDGNEIETKNTEFEYREIFPAIENDSDFTRMKCHETPCLFAIQQIYS